MAINHSHIIRLEDYAQLPPFDDRKFIQKHLQDVISELDQKPYQQNIRQLTVAYHFRQLCGWHAENKCVPRINLLGNWVQRAGFEIGSSFHVIPLKNLLIICRDIQFIKRAV